MRSAMRCCSLFMPPPQPKIRCLPRFVTAPRTYLGPRVGWIMAPLQNLQPITAAGTYTIDPSTNLIEVNIARPLTIVLPSAPDPGGLRPGPAAIVREHPGHHR